MFDSLSLSLSLSHHHHHHHHRHHHHSQAIDWLHAVLPESEHAAISGFEVNAHTIHALYTLATLYTTRDNDVIAILPTLAELEAEYKIEGEFGSANVLTD